MAPWCALSAGVAFGVGVADGLGDPEGRGLAEGATVGVGENEGDGDGEGRGVAVGESVGVAEGVGKGVHEGVGVGVALGQQGHGNQPACAVPKDCRASAPLARIAMSDRVFMGFTAMARSLGKSLSSRYWRC